MGGQPLAEGSYQDFEKPPHNYKTRPLHDPFSKMISRFETEPGILDRSSEKAFLLSLLKVFDVPVNSQMLVFSTTSLQLSLISPSNPRAIYFNEEIYVGFIPGGRIEIVSLDPELGGIYYIFDIPRGERPLRFERSNRCMNCHVSEDTGFVPGLVIQSVVPGPTGGSLDAFRNGQSGHGIPFEERFGGWHVTGKHGITNHWGNLTGRMAAGEITRIPNEPGTRFRWEKYPVNTSDILPHLLHEHQAGFVNRVVEAAYRARAGELDPDEQAEKITRYLLFADEAPLPRGGVAGDPKFKKAFLRNRRPNKDGFSLKDFSLENHLFKNRCSYMIYTPVFGGLPRELKERVYYGISKALRGTNADYSYLPEEEKKAIHSILQETLPDLPHDF